LNENLARIGELAKLLNSFARPPENGEHSVVFNVVGGESYGDALLSLPEISVVKLYISEGTDFPVHKHETMELIYVITGSVLLYIVEDEKMLLPGEHHCIESNTIHSMHALEDSVMWAVTIPTAKGFMNDSKVRRILE